MEMESKKLEDIVEIIAGQSPISKYYNNEGTGYPFLQGKIDFGDIYPNAKTWCTEPKKVAKNKDILLSVRAPVGAVNIANTDVCIGRGICAIRAKDNCYYKYLYYYLKTNTQQIQRYQTGSTFKSITVAKIKQIKIPLPENLDDQIRIANLLSQVESLIAKREESIKLLDELLKSTFLDMFGNPILNEKKWIERDLGSIFKVKHGYAFKSEFFRDSGKFILLTPGNFFEKGGFKDRENRRKYYVGEIPSEYILNKDDLLLAMTEQAPGLLGSPMIVPEPKQYLHNQRLGLVSKHEPIQSLFLFYLFNQKSIRQIIHSKATGTKVRHTSPTKIENIKIGYPPKPLQDKFATIVLQVEQTKQEHQKSLQELKNLFASLSQRAFRGDLDLNMMKK